MKISTKVITDCNAVMELENAWNRLLEISGENPFLYSRIVSELMHASLNLGWTPLVFTFWSGDKLVGLVPLIMRKMFQVNYVRDLNDVLYTDIFISKEYCEVCITQMIEFLFNRLKCISVALAFQSNAPNLKMLKKICHKKGIHFLIEPIIGRSIFHVECDWEQFYGSLKGGVRKEFRRRKRKLSDLGTWKICCYELDSKSVERVFAIEKTSWKNKWREQHGIQKDDLLHIFFRASQANGDVEPIYKSEVWFLELNGQAIAYVLVFIYKGTAFFVKTSYNLQFKKYAPGKFLTNEIIREIFRAKIVTRIDFVTNLPDDKIWNPLCEKRVKIIVRRKSIIVSFLSFIYKNLYHKVLSLQYNYIKIII
jgi:hypothetical protein